jgi:hypothetical protein
MSLALVLHEGLHYCPLDILTVDGTPATQCSPAIHWVAGLELPPGAIPDKRKTRSRFFPVRKAKQVESEVWLLHLSSPVVRQFDLLLGHVTGIPSEF